MLDLTWSHGRLLEQLVELGALKMRPQAASVFAVEVQNLQHDLDEIRELLNNSWWEPGVWCWHISVRAKDTDEDMYIHGCICQ